MEVPFNRPALILAAMLVLDTFSTISHAGAVDENWFLETTPQKALAQDIENGVYHFLTVCGFSCQPSGVGWVDSKRCYPTNQTEVIGYVGDTGSRSDFELQDKARVFAEEYNQMLVTYFDKEGMRQCPIGESWDAAQEKLHGYVKSIGGGNSEGFNRNQVGGISDPIRFGYDFDVNIEKSSMTETAYRKICSIINADLASTRVVILISNASPPHEEVSYLICLAGSVQSLVPVRNNSE